MKINALMMDEQDNVVTCVTEVPAGEEVVFRKGTELQTVQAEENIPYCHKIALTDLPAGSDVIKYGELIGRTTEDVKKGHWVSDRNILSVPRDYENEMIPLEADGSVSEAAKEQYTWGGNPGEGLSADEILAGLNVVRDPQTGRMQFWGYKRQEGRAGIRNHVLILPTCACGSESSRIVASQVRGAVNIVFNTGCSDVAANTAMSQKVLTGFALNPNVYGVVIIGLGCETVGHRKLREKIQALTSKPVVSFGIQEEGGTLKTIEKAVRAAREMAAEAGLQQKELCDISELLLGIECGGSDATSGIASNPAVGECSDLLVDLGASSILSESIEWIGGEHIVARRAVTPELHNQVIEVCRAYEEHLKAAGQDCRAGQPTPGNKAGGLSTLDEKSLGCIRKGGTRPVTEVLEQAVRPQGRGAMVMDTAGYDISSVTSMVAGGCNLVIFTTGRGTPTGNAIVPVLKVTANERTFRMMDDNMDVDLSPIVRGEKSYKEMGRELIGVISEVMNGRLTKAEAYGFSDIAVDHVCRYV
ncbi:MAG: altronate dehydratase [Solobacterium sp.]|nr:altronate dehydratase [Solobacterium sp.]MBQ6357129.1 altronate dehydratase [Solobacterium sp.]MBQ6532663.1 altronate dehydratase [Solobacterium sp.]MBR0213423.1 altronate dehydratase [Solobacterium sp.]